MMNSFPKNPIATPIVKTPSPQKANQSNCSQAWYRPTFSLEHGVYIMLLVSFLSGAALAVDWTWATTFALVCAFCGFQAEHPLVVQLKQRRSFKPRFLIWGGVYSGVAIAIALYLYWQQESLLSPLLWIYLGAIAAFLIDAISVFRKQQKSVFNELITFGAVCLSAPLAYVATTGTLSTSALGLWLLNSLFFSSAIFTVKFRKHKQHPITPSLAYHTIASLLAIGLWAIGWLSPLTAIAFSVALLKFGIILWQKDWYCTTKIQFVAMLETGTALLFLLIATLSVLPAHFPS